MSSTQYKHKFIEIECTIQSESLKKKKIKIPLPSSDNWDKNLKSIVKRIPKKFKFLSKMNDSEWLLIININNKNIAIDRNNGNKFGELLTSIPPPVIIKIIDSKQYKSINTSNENNLQSETNTNELIIEYKSKTFSFIPSNPNTEDEDEWENNYNQLLKIINNKYKLTEDDFELMDKDECECECGEDLMSVWQFLVDDTDTFSSKLAINITNSDIEAAQEDEESVDLSFDENEEDINEVTEDIIDDMSKDEITGLQLTISDSMKKDNNNAGSPINYLDNTNEFTMPQFTAKPETNNNNNNNNLKVNKFFVRTQSMRTVRVGSTPKSILKARKEAKEKEEEEVIKTPGMTHGTQFKFNGLMDIKEDEEDWESEDDKSEKKKGLNVKNIIKNLKFESKTIKQKLIELGTIIGLLEEPKKKQSFGALQGILNKITNEDMDVDNHQKLMNRFQRLLGDVIEKESIEYVEPIFKFFKLLMYDIRYINQEIILNGTPSKLLLEDITSSFYHLSNAMQKPRPNIYEQLKLQIPANGSVVVHESGVNCKDFVIFTLPQIVMENQQTSLVDKCVLNPIYLQRFINFLVPSAAKYDCKEIFFEKLKKMKVSTVGLFGSREEVLNMLSEFNAISKQLYNAIINDEQNAYYLQPGIHAIIPVNLHKNDNIKKWNHVIYLFYLSLGNSFDMNRMKVKFMRKDPSCLLTRVLYEISSSVLIQVSTKELNDFGVLEVQKTQSNGIGNKYSTRRRQKLNFKLEETKSNHIMCSIKSETKRLQIITKTSDGDSWKEFEVSDKIDCYSDSGWYIAKIKKMKRFGIGSRINLADVEDRPPIESIYIHYPGWGNEYDEWILLDGACCDCKESCLNDKHLIAPPNTQTRYQKLLNNPEIDADDLNNIHRQMSTVAADTFLLGGNGFNGFVNLYQQPQRDGEDERYQSFKSKQELFDFFKNWNKNHIIKWNHTFSQSNGTKLLAECFIPNAFHDFNIQLKEIEAKQNAALNSSKIKLEADKILLERNKEILYEFHDFYVVEECCKSNHDEIKKIITELGDELDSDNKEALQYIYLDTAEIVESSFNTQQYSSWRDIILERIKNDINGLMINYNNEILQIKEINEIRKQQNEIITSWLALYTEALREYKQDIYGYSDVLNIKRIKSNLEQEIIDNFTNEKQLIVTNLEHKIKQTQKDKDKKTSLSTFSRFMYKETYDQYDISYLVPIKIPPSYYMQFISIDLPNWNEEIRTSVMRNMQYEMSQTDKVIFSEILANGDTIMFIQSDNYERKTSETKIITSNSRTLTFETEPAKMLKKDRVKLVAFCASQKLFAILFEGGVLAFCVYQDGGRVSFTNKMSQLHDLKWFDEDMEFVTLLIQEINKNVFVYLIDENNICRAYDYDANSWDTAKRFTLDQTYNAYLIPPTGSFLVGIKPQYEHIKNINMEHKDDELDLNDMDKSKIDKLLPIQKAKRDLIYNDLLLTELNAKQETMNGFKSSFSFKDLSENQWVLHAIVNKQDELSVICIVETDDEFANKQTLNIEYKYWFKLYLKMKCESLIDIKYPTGRIQIHAFLLSEKKKLEYKISNKSSTGYEDQDDSKDNDQVESYVDNALLPQTFLLTHVNINRIKIQEIKKDQFVVCTVDNDSQLLYHLMDISVSEAKMKINREAKKSAIRKITKLDYMEYMVEKFGSRAAVFYPEEAILAFHTTYFMQDGDTSNPQNLCDQIAEKICKSLNEKEKKNFQYFNWKCNVLKYGDNQSIGAVLRSVRNKPIVLTGEEFIKNLIIQLPIQIARGANNKFQLMYNGADEQMEYIKAGDPYQLCKKIRFGAYDGLIKSWEGEIKIVTSMGKQSTGKSYMLNHLFGTKFDISGGRCTDGAWLSARYIEDVLFIICDFEGLGSFERSPQEDMLLATFNSAVSNCTIFKCDNRFDRTVEDMFNKFQSGVKIMKGSSLCFQGELLLVIKDVVETGAEAAVNDFNRHIERLAQESDVIMTERGVKESTFFVNQMYKNGLSLIPYPPLANKAFFRELNETLQPAFDDIEVLHEGGKQFLSHIKLIMAKLHIGDWSAMSGEQAKIRATEIRANLPNAVEAGAIIQPKNTEFGVTFEVDDDQNLLLLDGNKVIQTDLQNEVIPKIKKYKQRINACSENDSKIEAKLIEIVYGLNDAGLMLGRTESLDFLWEQFSIRIKRTHDNIKQITNLYSVFLDIIAQRRKVRVRKYIIQNTKKFEDQNEIDLISQAAESRLNIIRDKMKLCKAKCNECFYLCLLCKNHEDNEDEPDEHSCNQLQHSCKEFCAYCKIESGKNILCGDKCGHAGKHNCRHKNHTCGLICSLSKYGGCQIKCNLESGHNKSTTPCKCAAETHKCPDKCAVPMCKNTCIIAYDKHHINHICIQSYCSYKCQVQTWNDSLQSVTDCGRPCSHDDHDHELKMKTGECKDEGHICNRQHQCPEPCNEKGNCIVSIQRKIIEKQVYKTGAGAKIEYDSYADVNGGKRRCCKKIPVGEFKHDKSEHKCYELCAKSENIHTCNTKCDSCGYFCQLKYGHYEEAGTFHDCVHGNMRNTRFYSTTDYVDTGDGRTYKIGDVGIAEMCNIFCQRQGRGHIHLEYCQYNLKNEQCVEEEGRRHQTQLYKPDEHKEKDEVKHSKFWRRKKWKDPCLDKFKSDFEKCPFVCQHISHKEKEEERKNKPDDAKDDGDEDDLIKYCTGKLWHKPAIDNGGHIFRCKHPFRNAHVIFICDVNDSMGSADNGKSLPTLSFITGELNNRLGCVYESVFKFIKCRIELKCRDKCSAIIFSEKSKILSNHIEINIDFVKNYLLKYKPGHFNQNKIKPLRLTNSGSMKSKSRSDPNENNNQNIYNVPSKVITRKKTSIDDIPNMIIDERIKLPNGKTGVIKYIGIPNNIKQELIGIELDTFDINISDGNIYNQQLFKTTKGKGYFIYKKELNSIMEKSIVMEGIYCKLTDLIRVPKFNGKTCKIIAYEQKKERWKIKLINTGQSTKYLGVKTDNLIPILDWQPIETENNNNILQVSLKIMPNIGDKVVTNKNKYGIVKFIGNIESYGKYIGLQLNKSDDLNGNNGHINNKKYFDVQNGFGYFVKLKELTENLGSDNDNDNKNIMDSNDINIGDNINLKNGYIGIIKFIGKTHFSENKQMYGIELNNWTPNGNNGIINETKYFKVDKNNYGYFAMKQEIEYDNKNDNELELKIDDDDVDIGDNIITKNGYKGIVKFKGKVDFNINGNNNNIIIGIELNKWSPNGNNGIINKHKYFECKNGFGYFIELKYVNTNNNNNNMNRLKKSTSSLRVGDKVKLTRGNTGVVKFIGETDFTKGEIIGLELEQWTPAGHNGTVRGKKYFDALDGRGYFTRRVSINVVQHQSINNNKPNINNLGNNSFDIMLNEMSNDINDNMSGMSGMGMGMGMGMGDISGMAEMMRGKSDLTKINGGAKQYLDVFENIEKLINYKEETVILFITDDNENIIDNGSGDIMQEIKSKMKNKLSMYCITLNNTAIDEIKKISNVSKAKLIQEIDGIELSTVCVQIAKEMNSMAQNMSRGAFI